MTRIRRTWEIIKQRVIYAVAWTRWKLSKWYAAARQLTAKKVMLYSRRYEHRPWVKKVRETTDFIVTTTCNREYKGENEAVRAIYGPLRITMIAMLVLFFVIFVIGSLAPIKSAALAKGTIVVLSNNKTVQHLEGGIIRDILVSEGQLVKKGQTLIELNDISPKAARNIARIELYMARITEARLMALKQEKEEMEIAAEILEAAAENKDLKKTIDTQRDLFLTQRDLQEGKMATLKQRIEEYNEEIGGFEAQVKSAEGQLALIQEEIEPMERLVAKRYAAKPQLLALHRKKEELEGNRGQYTANIAKTKQSIGEAELQLTTLRHEFASQIADELGDAQAKISDNEERLASAADIMHRTTITSPYEGIVTGMKYHTVGAVISPGEALMDIIPQNEPLVIDAQVQPADIDVVSKGLHTRIVFSAYKTRSMPRLTGEVTRVSADVLATKDIQPVHYYNARVEVSGEELARLKSRIHLYPGMPVEVFIETGSRSFMGYLFAPITSSLERAFKED
ncbi:MAG: HlyD family type I secretion periplasmic adaptor subunit [Azospirillum brasilense]|nr:MAG: HlyD family type I secretion periplasmic adaptor subunit [Azospirillum brasilense]